MHWDTSGNPSYHPRVLLHGVIQGYIDAIKSGCELGRCTKTDLPHTQNKNKKLIMFFG